MHKTQLIKTLSVSILCTLLAIILAVIGICASSTTDIVKAEETNSKESRFLNFIDQNIAGMNSEYKSTVTRNKVKTLYDFAGNTYTLIECNPTGYMIMCDDSATMVEYSATSLSPYKDFAVNLYYAGPSYFYVYQNGKYIHTITGEVLNYPSTRRTATSTNNSIVSACTKMHQDLTSNSNNAALNYIKTGIQTRTEIIGYYGQLWTCVNNMAFFAGKTTRAQIGYKDGGYCGYIAAGMLIGYYDTFVRECMDNQFMTGSGISRHFVGTGLTDRIYSCRPSGAGNSTTSTIIRKTLNNYFKKYHYNLGSYDMITPFFSGTTLKNLIDKSTPSILFGDLGPATSPTGPDSGSGGNHAVVVYGYKNGGTGGALYSFLVHYGWSGYSIATVNYTSYSVFGSMYRIKL